MSQSELSALIEDIRINGQQEPILLFEGLVADGRHRWMACSSLGITPKTVLWNGDEETLIRHIISVNLHRRHLSPTDRAILAMRYANLPKGTNRFTIGTAAAASMTQGNAARLFSVSADSIQRARKVSAQGSAELLEALSGGQISLSEAARLAKLSKEQQKEVLAAATLVRARQLEARRTRAREAIEARKGVYDPAFPDGEFDIAIIDPPWDYGNNALSTNCSPGFHRGLMSVQEIAAMRLPLAHDALVFVWVPSYFLSDVMTTILPAWGLHYAGCAVWKKVNGVVGAGMFRMTHEMVIAARKGAGVGKPDRQLPSVFEADPARQSGKPPILANWVDLAFPDWLRRIEIFSQNKRSGWAMFGADRLTATH